MPALTHDAPRAELAQLIHLPCSCGCGRPAATLRVLSLPDEYDGMVRAALSTIRLMSSDARKLLPRVPEGANPLAHIPPDMISGALGIVRPECAAAQLEASSPLCQVQPWCVRSAGHLGDCYDGK